MRVLKVVMTGQPKNPVYCSNLKELVNALEAMIGTEEEWDENSGDIEITTTEMSFEDFKELPDWSPF